MSEQTDELRRLLDRLKLSQRSAARRIRVREREFRRMCAGTRDIPPGVIADLRHLARSEGT